MQEVASRAQQQAQEAACTVQLFEPAAPPQAFAVQASLPQRLQERAPAGMLVMLIEMDALRGEWGAAGTYHVRKLLLDAGVPEPAVRAGGGGGGCAWQARLRSAAATALLLHLSPHPARPTASTHTPAQVSRIQTSPAYQEGVASARLFQLSRRYPVQYRRLLSLAEHGPAKDLFESYNSHLSLFLWPCSPEYAGAPAAGAAVWGTSAAAPPA